MKANIYYLVKSPVTMLSAHLVTAPKKLSGEGLLTSPFGRYYQVGGAIAQMLSALGFSVSMN
jgi:hypothetical protein